MEMKDFADKICREVEGELGKEIYVEVREVRKNNGVILHGLLTRRQGCNVVPTIYLDTFLEAYEAGATFGSIVKRVLDICQENWEKGSMDMGFFHSFEQVRDRICYRLIGRKGNEEMLSEMPYIEFLDLAICFYYACDGELRDGMIQIDNTHMDMWDTCTAELFGLSKRNTPRLFPWAYEGLYGILEQMGNLEGRAADSDGFREKLCGEVPIMVLSNTRRVYGAACILYPGVLEEMVRRMGGVSSSSPVPSMR